jgi:hypothetical protein
VLAVDFERKSFLTGGKPVKAGQLATAGLLELGAHCLHIRCGDDLVALFNT